MIKDKICVALDVDGLGQAERLAKLLSPYVGVFKIGLQLFTSEGPRVVEVVRNAGGRVFLDLKFHDIPNTALNAAKVAVRMGVFMTNVHSMGGTKMMRAVADAVREEAEKADVDIPLMIGVTVLTSMSDEELKDDLLVNVSAEEYVAHLAGKAEVAGMDGVVCSPREIGVLREKIRNDFVLVTPGIRPQWSFGKDDQSRVMTPRKAIEAGSDFIVVGRPITGAKDPTKAAQMLLEELA